MDSSAWSAIISAIALIVAILSPVLTSILNNKHQDKVWERENIYLRKQKAISDYIQNTGILLKNKRYSDVAPYGSSYGEIFFYAPKDAWPLIKEIDNCISAGTGITEKSNAQFDELCEILAKELSVDK